MNVLAALELEARLMEERSPRRKEGEGDPKYQILFRFLDTAKKTNFEESYARLSEPEQHVIITRLENQVLSGNLKREVVETLRRRLYGVKTDEDGEEWINRSKQEELETIVQKMSPDRS